MRKGRSAIGERGKVLASLYGISQVIGDPESSMESKLAGLISPVREALQWPESAQVRITLDQCHACTPGFAESENGLSVIIATQGGKKLGSIDVVYLDGTPAPFTGKGTIFLPEEEDLLNAVSSLLAMSLEKEEANAQKKELETQLRHADRLAKIGQLAAGIAHELNNPLGDILGFAQLASNLPDLPEQVYLDLEKILKSSLYAREIVRKLMLFSRQMPPRETNIQLNRLVEEWMYFLESRCAKGGVKVIKELDPNLPEVKGDPSQLSQVFVNLTVNAIQAMPKGGKLHVRTCALDGGVRLVVEDTGVGMDEETLKQIFMPFFTTKDVDQGTGLGLAVVYGIIKSHKGNISAESKIGKGTRFIIDLPLFSSLSGRENADG